MKLFFLEILNLTREMSKREREDKEGVGGVEKRKKMDGELKGLVEKAKETKDTDNITPTA